MDLNLDQQLSPSFHLREFLASQIAARLGRPIIPTPEQLTHLRQLCMTVLQPLRDEVRRPIIVSSGLRPRWLNELIGGSRTSAHLDGRAADVRILDWSPRAAVQAIRRLDLPIDQCILEFDSWVHVGIATEELTPRREYLTARAVNGRTAYELGIA